VKKMAVTQRISNRPIPTKFRSPLRQVELLLGAGPFVASQSPEPAGQISSLLAQALANSIKGLPSQLRDMEEIEDDAGVGKVGLDSSDVGRAHVHNHLGNCLGLGSVGGSIRSFVFAYNTTEQLLREWADDSTGVISRYGLSLALLRYEDHRDKPSSTLLPDGTVLIVNGEQHCDTPKNVGDRTRPTLLDPRTSKVTELAPWTDDASMRGYHAISAASTKATRKALTALVAKDPS
jgi:hypothetical protein